VDEIIKKKKKKMAISTKIPPIVTDRIKVVKRLDPKIVKKVYPKK
jgi:hypothetical protein